MQPVSPTVHEDLQALGWRPFFAAQLAEHPDGRPARVLAVHRGRIDVQSADGAASVPLAGSNAPDLCVGDWVLLAADAPIVSAVLERQGAFRRRAAGVESVTQLIAANVDTLFIVTSANRDFNVARLERYLAIARDGGAFPVVVITKADTVESVADYVGAAVKLAPGLCAEAVDARDAESVAKLAAWCGPGQTVALLGSSGVGKSTLVNTLTNATQATHAAREGDQRGRHTTTTRSMHRLPSGGWLIDTPGMRELRLAEVGDAIDDVFSEIAALADNCRFADCSHGSEPGCAVRAAIAAGQIEEARLLRYQKLAREDRHNTMSVAERRSHDKSLGKHYRAVQSARRRDKGG